ncbi:MAG: acyl-CoA dehydratase activase-related protein [Deltaproteobacteria bacterium]
MRIGIPGGLFYFYYFPLWKTFFTDLGAEVITSSATSRLTIDAGSGLAVDEACLPVKVYYGHIRELCSRSLDYLFAPRLVSVEPRSYICPKFMGIPDMLRAQVPDLPELIDITIDLSKDDRWLNRDIIRLGKMLGKKRRTIQEAFDHALEENRRCNNIAHQGWSMAEAIRIWEGDILDKPDTGDLSIGLLGHGYSLYDEGLSMGLIRKIRQMGCKVCMLEGLDPETIETEAATLPKRVFWTLGRKIMGSVINMDNSEDIDGIIYLACFGCGPDSLIGEMAERYATNKPFMLLTIDEHSGEAGMLTRLEAFCDMLRRRRRIDESQFPAYG